MLTSFLTVLPMERRSERSLWLTLHAEVQCVCYFPVPL